MAGFRRLFFRAVITAWFMGFAAFTLCWQCDRWLPEKGLHFGDRRLARGEQFWTDRQNLRQINLAWGNAQQMGYSLNFYPDDHLFPPIQFYRTWNWKRSDLQGEPDPTMWFAVPSRCDFSWQWQAAGVSASTWHDYGGNFQDECDQQIVELYPKPLWRIAAGLTAGLLILLVAKRIFRLRRRGFAVEPASSGMD